MLCGHGAKGIKAGWKGKRNKRICLRSCDMHKTETSANPYQKQYGLADVWFIRLNLLACRGHSQARDNAQSCRSTPSGHTLKAYCTAASPVLPAAPGCCRIRPPRRCSQWQEWCLLEPGFHSVGVHVVSAGKQFVHRKSPFI